MVSATALFKSSSHFQTKDVFFYGNTEHVSLSVFSIFFHLVQKIVCHFSMPKGEDSVVKTFSIRPALP